MALILDGTSPAGAWSMYRDLLTAFVGGTRYTTATGVNQLTDQSGNARHLIQATAANQPAVATAGPNSRSCADFDGTNDYLATAALISTFIGAGTGYIVASFIADTVATNSATTYLNDPVFADLGGYTGIYLKTDGTINAANFSGTDTKATSTISTGTVYVVEWRHQATVLYLRVNGGTETSIGSGNTANLTNAFGLARASGGALADIKVFELATFSTVPSLATRDAIVADFMAQHVAAPAGRAKVWSGSAWTVKPAKVWSGSAWVTKPVKVWNGSAWV